MKGVLGVISLNNVKLFEFFIYFESPMSYFLLMIEARRSTNIGINGYVDDCHFCLWICAEQGKDLDEFFQSTAGMIVRIVFYSCYNLQLLKYLTTLKDKVWIYNH